MVKKYRALRFVATCARVIAWVILVLGILAALGAVVVGALQGRVGEPSPLLAPIPLLGTVVDLGRGLLAGAAILAAAVLQFVLLHAFGDLVHLGLAIEQSTRETADLLSGEGTLPPPPTASAWNEPLSSLSADE